MEHQNKELLLRKIANYKRLLATYDNLELRQLENDIYGTDDEIKKISYELSDICDYKKAYKGIYNDVLITAINESYSELNQIKKHQEDYDYNHIKMLLSICDLILGENVGFLETLKYIDLNELNRFLENVEGHEYGR